MRRSSQESLHRSQAPPPQQQAPPATMRSLSCWVRNAGVFLLFAVGNNPFNIRNVQNDQKAHSAILEKIDKPIDLQLAEQQLQQQARTRSKEPLQALEFVHIPKTGGSSVEYAGAQHGISWGRCHYDLSIDELSCPKELEYRQYARDYLQMIPKEDQWAPFWHIPPKFFRRVKDESFLPTGGINPYPVGTPLFAIVRNPYTRLVSEWYFANQVQMKSSPENYNNVTKFNIFLQEKLAKLMELKIWEPQTNMKMQGNAYWMKNAHFIPQSDFIYDDNGRQIVQHVFKFESMAEGFAALMAEYGMSHVKLRKQKSNVSKNTQLSVRHISGRNFEMINKLYARDFKKFRYRMHIPNNKKG